MAAQTIEKYLKAILLDRGRNIGGHRHDIVALCKAVGDPFTDVEFLAVCDSLSPFEIAGRYDDGHELENWEYSANLLSLLDVFAVRCRALIGTQPERYRNNAAALLMQSSKGNAVMPAAEIALKDNNEMLVYLVQPWPTRDAGDA